MTDLQRDIGVLEARVDEHEKRFDRVETMIETGFKDLRAQFEQGFGRVHERIDELAADENKRKGALGLVKLLFSGSIVTGLYEAAKTLFGGHK